jgi:hypothetical protein
VITGRAEVFLQWKGTDACYDFYCPCSPDEPQHWDGYFGGEFTCGKSSPARDESEGREPAWCGKRWRLPWSLTAAEIEDPG